MTPEELREKAARYRMMANQTSDLRLIEALLTLADEYEAVAKRLENVGPVSEQMNGA